MAGAIGWEAIGGEAAPFEFSTNSMKDDRDKGFNKKVETTRRGSDSTPFLFFALNVAIPLEGKRRPPH
jgi:hypothetical protein